MIAFLFPGIQEVDEYIPKARREQSDAEFEWCAISLCSSPKGRGSRTARDGKINVRMIGQAFDILEFGGLRGLVSRGVQTNSGRETVDRLGPINDLDELRRDLRSVAEMIELRRRGARLFFDGISNPPDSISRLKIEG